MTDAAAAGGEAICRPADPHPRPARFRPPAGACDSHAHIIGDTVRYPMVANRSYTPPEAGLAAYRHMLETLGLSRAVIVQPSFYGQDNRCTRDALRASGGAWRGVAVVPPDVDAAALRSLHADGFRGARFNLLFGGGVALDALERVATRVAQEGWHIQLLMDIRQLPGIADRLLALPCAVVFDHLGHFPAQEGMESAVSAALQRLLDGGRCWVKLSGGYRLSSLPPPYGDLRAVAGWLAARWPERMLWGSDWPHTAFEGDMPNDGDLLDTLADWVPDEATRQRILVDNPARLYGF